MMIDRPIILSVETATRRGSVSVSKGREVLSVEIGAPQSSHSNTLLRDINKVLEKSKILLSQVQLLAVAAGPGSFTGLRIGLATVKALAATLKLPCIGIPSLHAVARAAGESKASIALLPAGRGEVFAQMLSVLSDDTVIEVDKPAHLSPQELRERYGPQTYIRWCGEGAHLHRDQIEEWAAQKGIDFCEIESDAMERNENGWQLAPLDFSLAQQVAGLALTQFEQGHTGDPNSLRALYVRPSDAELKHNVNNAASSG
ncbi:MAG TPA: tRNA (adenosine(37)-N6)-threonylcarbamoyltransferase complex dimerization subunit type 1 TsaB [Pyrinomonadaceae bacterium]|nr:tRNA (adenosine(37)-N6)-threonylcarbamoyltransferase complex dimerization subunit type 1 TsaB [Pyrinomonadaceae bacterium]